jgi:hypothetical protein
VCPIRCRCRGTSSTGSRCSTRRLAVPSLHRGAILATIARDGAPAWRVRLSRSQHEHVDIGSFAGELRRLKAARQQVGPCAPFLGHFAARCTLFDQSAKVLAAVYAITRVKAKPGIWCWAVAFRRRGPGVFRTAMERASEAQRALSWFRSSPQLKAQTHNNTAVAI